MTSPLIIATDGSALGNPGPTGWCWYIDDQNWMAGGLPHGTNNIGELLAVQRALQSALPHGRSLIIECDSKYAIQALTQWSHSWKRNGWKTSAGAPVSNRDIIEPTLELLVGANVEFRWIKGHAGHHRNENADVRARDGATRAKGGLQISIGPGLNL